MLNRHKLFILIYAFIVTVVETLIFMLGEQRIDAYVAVNILIYYVVYAVVRPPSSTYSRFLNISLLSIFAVIVAYRIYEVLTSW